MALDIRPITATLGAEVRGVDMARVDDGTRDELRKAWLDHKLLVLRDQHITTEEHIAFGRLFGDLEVHPFTDDDGEHPEIVVLHADGENRFVASGWHSDVTWREEPSMGSILRGVIIPPAGGDTCFADATAAYDRLSDGWKDRLDGLVAVHDYLRVFGRRIPEGEEEAMRETYPLAHHPVIRTHPETGAKAIYTNIGFTSHIADVAPEESAEILARLRLAIMDPSVQCRIRWEVDTFVRWDNRSTQHCATDDFLPNERRMERVTVVGDRPF